MALTEVTEDAMMVTGMSLLGTDQARLNMGMPSIVFSAAQGAMEGTLNLVNADTHSEERIEMEIQNQREKDNDIVDIAMAEMTNSVEENLRRIRDGQVTYANGQFNIGGIMVDEEDMDATVDDMVDNFDDVIAKHNLNAQESAVLMALLVEYQNENDPQVKADLLQKIKDDVSPQVALDMANEANAIGKKDAERNMSAQESNVQMVALENDAIKWKSAADNLVDQDVTLERATSLKTDDIDVGGIDPFADMMAASGEFNPAANGETQMAEVTIKNAVSASPTLQATI